MKTSLWCIDLDDTLFTSDVTVKEKHLTDGSEIEIHSHAWPQWTKKLNCVYDFSNFKCEKTFIDTAKPIPGNWELINRFIAINQDYKFVVTRAIVTARPVFNNQQYFISHLRHKLNIDDLPVYCVGDEPYDTASECKYQVIKQLIINQNFDEANLVDDSVLNLNRFLDLRKDFPDKTFHAYLVQGQRINRYEI